MMTMLVENLKGCESPGIVHFSPPWPKGEKHVFNFVLLPVIFFWDGRAWATVWLYSKRSTAVLLSRQQTVSGHWLYLG